MKILIVKLADLGDLLLSEPAIRSMRRSFPDAQIDVLTTPHAAGLLPYFNLQTNALTFEKSIFDRPGIAAATSAWDAASLAATLRAASYDTVVILHHLTTSWGAAKYRALALAAGAPVIAGLDNGRGTFLTHAAVDRGFGVKHETEYMLNVALAAGGAFVEPRPCFDSVHEELPVDLPENFVAIAPAAGAFSMARIWPVERFCELAEGLVDADYSIVVVGGDDAREAGNQIVEKIGASNGLNLAGRTSLNQLALVIERASGLVGNDSFPAILSDAIGTATLTIFGPSNPKAWGPRSSRSRALTLDLPCSPCLYTGYRLGRPAGCPARSCLNQITPSMALEEMLELLGA